MDNCDSFTPLAPFLSEKFHYIALDAYGHGLTSHVPPGVAMNHWDLVLFVRRTVQHFKLQKLSILGHSMGGSTGVLYASLYPENVDRLLMLDIQKPVCLPLPWHHHSVREAMDVFLEHEKKEKMLNAKENGCTAEGLAQHYVKSMNGTISLEAAKLLMKRGSKHSGDGFIYAHDTRVVCIFSYAFWSRLLNTVIFSGDPIYIAIYNRRAEKDHQRSALSFEDSQSQTRPTLRAG